MIIKGLQKLTLLDFPDKMACTLFTFGCNFRCPYCHNASLVLSDRADNTLLSEEEIFTFLTRRKGMLEGVCITGGEPTLQPDLPDFIAHVKDMGYAVKLDTNGYRPSVLRDLVTRGLLDYVAMDIKNSMERYPETVGIARFDTAPVEASMDFLLEGRVPFEFRTTLVRGLHTVDSVRAMGERAAGEESFFLQTFKDSGDLLCDGLEGFTPAETQTMLDALRQNVPNAQIRGE